MDQLGRRQASRTFSRGQLWLRSVRGHPLIRNKTGSRDLPPPRAHATADQLREDLPHGASLLRRRVCQHGLRTGPAEKNEFVLREAHRAAWIRRSGRESAELTDRHLYGLLAMGRLSRAGSAGEGRRSGSELLDAHRPEYVAG